MSLILLIVTFKKITPMKIKKTHLDGLLVIEPKTFKDDRGFFETYQYEGYYDAGIFDDFVQENQSRSIKGVLRDMHKDRRRSWLEL